MQPKQVLVRFEQVGMKGKPHGAMHVLLAGAGRNLQFKTIKLFLEFLY